MNKIRLLKRISAVSLVLVILFSLFPLEDVGIAVWAG